MGKLKAESSSNWEELQVVMRNQLKPYGLKDSFLLEKNKPHKRRLVEIIKRTSLMGESNSMIIIGPRGSGKSALLESAIADLSEDSVIQTNLLHVRLNGLIHTDDNIALKDIMVQLNLEGIGDRVTGSFAEKLTILLDALKSGSKHSKSILFILDEFDLFCGHKDQTLLYNLFDVAQSQQSPICVVGLSCRPDVLHKLENRVKSRFSHQQIYLFDSIEFSNYLNAARQILLLPQTFPDKTFVTEWNDSIQSVMEHTAVKDILKKYFQYSCNLRDLKKMLFYVLSSVGPSHPKLEPVDFISAFNFHFKDYKSAFIQGLSILEVSLVIAMMHLTELYDGEPFNLEMVYHEYKKFLQKQMSFQNVDKAVVMKSFEHLLAIELVKEVTSMQANTLKRFMPVRLLLEPNQVKEALKHYPNLPSQLQQWSASIIFE